MTPFWRKVVFAGAGAAATAAIAKHLRRPSLNLAGKVVLITGGSRGFGLALASRLGRMGCRIALCARDNGELLRAAARLQPHCSEVRTYQCDLTNPAEISALIGHVAAGMGSLDGLVNNAGLVQVGPAQAMTLDDYSEALDLMFWAPLRCITEALPHFRKQGAGFIVNVTSIGGKVSVPHLLPYSCAKFALTGLSEGLTAELAGENIRVLTVAPGLMRTGSPIRAEVRGNHRAEYNWFALSDNMPGLSMQPDRAARQVVEALVNGRREIILTVPANILSRMHGAAPDLMIRAMEVAAAALPDSPDAPTPKLNGAEVQAGQRSTVVGRVTEMVAKRAVERYQNLALSEL
jgi:NAD(P)-dependent dehydrogenase (short-subunit alcohol dehydrogenase family)